MATQPGDSPRSGTAQLGTDPRNPQTLMAGALLANGSRLIEIYSDHVVLERGGNRTTLKLDQAAGIEAGGPQVVRSGFMGSNSSEAVRQDLTTIAGQAVSPTRSPAPAGSIRDINDVIRAQPVFRERDVTGIALIPGQSGRYFTQLGLQQGDVVVGIDGRAVTSVKQWTDASASLLAGQRVYVRVERQGQALAMELDGGALLKEESPPPFPPGIAGAPGPAP